MTVVACAKGVLVGDQLHVLEKDNDIRRRINKPKLYIDNEETLAFAYTGSEIYVPGLSSIFMAMKGMIKILEKNPILRVDSAYLCDVDIKSVLNLKNRQYLAITANQTYMFDHTDIITLDSDDVFSLGSDSEYFKALYNYGMPIEEIIPHIHRKLSSTVSKEFDLYRQIDLKPMRYIEDHFEGAQTFEDKQKKYQSFIREMVELHGEKENEK